MPPDIEWPFCFGLSLRYYEQDLFVTFLVSLFHVVLSAFIHFIFHEPFLYTTHIGTRSCSVRCYFLTMSNVKYW